jgi:hypothetical protein
MYTCNNANVFGVKMRALNILGIVTFQSCLTTLYQMQQHLCLQMEESVQCSDIEGYYECAEQAVTDSRGVG